ncbi:MAG TPA: hypothetical protein VLK79_13640 [Gaiellales bacterium]|nr:hypothetical protein [Gaiellales bacterium]
MPAPPADASSRPPSPQSDPGSWTQEVVEVVSRRISDQRTEALGQANAIRERRAALKRRLKDGEESLATLILDPPDYLHTARIEMLVMTTPGVGKVRSQTLLRDAGIPAKTTVGRLTERQRTTLATKLPAPRG